MNNVKYVRGEYFMNKKLYKILIVSVIFNVFILLLGSVYVYKKGGVVETFNSVTGLFVRQNSSTDVMQKPEYIQRVLHFKTLPVNKESIVFVGDSITAGCEWSELFQDSNVKNRGIGYDTVSALNQRIDDVIPSKKIFIMAGLNDLTFGATIETTVLNYEKLIEKITKKSPRTEIFIQSVLPVNSKLFTIVSNSDIIKLNEKLKAIAQDYKLTYVDLFSVMLDGSDLKYTNDGRHLTGEGYMVWKEVIKKYIN